MDTSCLKILVVEDEPLILESIVELLRVTFNFQILSAPHPVLALQILKTNKVDLLVTDIMMPQMQGMEFAGVLRSQGFTGPIIVISGFADKKNLLKALQLGVFDFLEKPFAAEQFFNCIHLAVQKIKSDVPIDYSVLNLTLQQQKIIKYLMEGIGNAEISEKVELSEPTVKYHIGKLLKKFDARDRNELKIKVRSLLQPPLSQLKSKAG